MTRFLKYTITSLTVLILCNICHSQTSEISCVIESILSDFICNNPDYKYESYYAYFKRTGLDVSNREYCENRNELPESDLVVYLDTILKVPQGTELSDFQHIFEDSAFEDNKCIQEIFDRFHSTFGDYSIIDVGGISLNCNFMIEQIEYSPNSSIGDRLAFMISDIVFSNNGKWACFYLFGGRGGGPNDWFIIAHKSRGNWEKFSTRTVNTY